MTDSKPIVIGADDAGLGLKGIIKGYLDDLGVAYDDVGVDTPDATALGIDYPTSRRRRRPASATAATTAAS